MRLDAVTKEFDGVPAVEDVTLDVADHDFMILLGPSGCGKSTLLRMIAGLEDPTAGDIYIGGVHVNDVEPKQRDVAMVFQSYALYPHKTVQANIEFPLKVRKVAEGAAGRRGAGPPRTPSTSTEYLGRKPGQLSGGQRQRVALARAIVRQPAVFCMDEPLSNLDAKLRTETRAELVALHQRLSSTFIYVTHDQVEAMTMGAHVAVMSRGRIEQVGTPQEVYARPATVFVAQFIGTPPMNIFPPGMVEPGDTLDRRAPGAHRVRRRVAAAGARSTSSSSSATRRSSTAASARRGSSCACRRPASCHIAGSEVGLRVPERASPPVRRRDAGADRPMSTRRPSVTPSARRRRERARAGSRW